jgi:hypothetical protein
VLPVTISAVVPSPPAAAAAAALAALPALQALGLWLRLRRWPGLTRAIGTEAAREKAGLRLWPPWWNSCLNFSETERAETRRLGQAVGEGEPTRRLEVGGMRALLQPLHAPQQVRQDRRDERLREPWHQWLGLRRRPCCWPRLLHEHWRFLLVLWLIHHCRGWLHLLLFLLQRLMLHGRGVLLLLPLRLLLYSQRVLVLLLLWLMLCCCGWLRWAHSWLLRLWLRQYWLLHL